MPVTAPVADHPLFLDPESLYAVSVLANRNRVDVDGYAGVLFDILEAGGASQDKARPGDENLGDYLGSYNLHPWGGEDLVFRWKDGLAIVSLPTMDPVGNMTLLKHVEGDRFQTIRSDGQPGYELLFQRDDSGRVSTCPTTRCPGPKCRSELIRELSDRELPDRE